MCWLFLMARLQRDTDIWAVADFSLALCLTVSLVLATGNSCSDEWVFIGRHNVWLHSQHSQQIEAILFSIESGRRGRGYAVRTPYMSQSQNLVLLPLVQAIRLAAHLVSRLPHLVDLLQPNGNETEAMELRHGYASCLSTALGELQEGDEQPESELGAEATASGSSTSGSSSNSATGGKGVRVPR